MSSSVQLPPLLAGGSPAVHAAVGRLLAAILPGCALVVTLVCQVLQAKARGADEQKEANQPAPEATAGDLLLIQQILNILADELPALLNDAAATPSAADRVLDQALSSDPACLGTLQKIDKLAPCFEGLDLDLSRRWSQAAVQPGWAERILPLLRRLLGLGAFVADLRTAAIGQPRFEQLLTRFRQGLRALGEADARGCRDIFLALVQDCPTSAAAALALGTALIVQGEEKAGRHMLERAAALHSGDSELVGLCRRFQADEPRPVGESAIPAFEHDVRFGPSPVVRFEIIGGPHEGTRFQFDQAGPVIVGRSPTANLALVNDSFISRHHFLLEPQPPYCYLRDLGSGNGTRVNGERVVECYLRHGDIVAAGASRLRFDVYADTPTVAQASILDQDTDNVELSYDQEQVSPPVVPGYDILGTLGEGGMGSVYLARSQARNQQVALKIIRPDLGGSQRSMKRFLREINVLRSLDHPRIVRFHEMGSVDGRLFFAMEYVRTINLRKLLGEQAPADRIRICCDITCQALEALGYAHDRGFVHRDVKSSNILVSGQEPDLHAHLADFGLAKNLQSTGLSAMTFDRELLGTLTFMAPEQVVDSRHARPGVDIYSLGATLYCLLSDRSPFDLKEHKNPPAAILQEEPVPLAHWCPWLPPELGRLVRRAMAKDPADRFPTALEMRSALLPYATVAFDGKRTVALPAR